MVFLHAGNPSLPPPLPEMLYLIGLGLADETDVTVKGLEVIRKVERVYLEAYTSILLVNTEKLVRSISLCEKHTGLTSCVSLQ